MEIKRSIQSAVNPNVSTETLSSNPPNSGIAPGIQRGVGGAKDSFEVAKADPFLSILATPSVVQKSAASTNQLVNETARKIVDSVLAEVDSSTNYTEIASKLGEAAAVVASIPVVGPIIAAILAVIAAIMQMMAELEKKKLEEQATVKEKEDSGNDTIRHRPPD